MPYEIGDTEPPHIDVHNELNAQVAELAERNDVEVVLPPIVSLGDSGHVNDHNLYTVAIQTIADNCKSGIEGLGDWATITQVTGTVTRNDYNLGEEKWTAFIWANDGSLFTTGAGIVDALVVGAGSLSSGSYAGTGGCVVLGVEAVTENTEIIVGQKATGGANPWASRSALGKLSAGGGNCVGNGYSPNGFRGYSSGGWGSGGGAGGPAEDVNEGGPGISSYISGRQVEYATGGGYSTTGSGPGCGSDRGANSQSTVYNATGGVVIIRVPQEYAQNVTENFNTWTCYATVDDGIVTQVDKVSDQETYKTAAGQIECPQTVEVGWIYEDGEFDAPPLEEKPE